MLPSKLRYRPTMSASSGSVEEAVEQKKQLEGEDASADSESSRMAAERMTSKSKEATAPATKTSGSSSDSESDSSESHEDKPLPPRRTTRRADPSIKPISSKPMDVAPKTKKTYSRKGTEKRKREEPDVAEEEESTEMGTPEKKPFQRVWTEEDEIALLKGMIEFKGRGVDPEAHLDDFHKGIRKSLHSEFSKTQLSDKIRRLKNKYEANVRRSRKGVEPSFVKPHDQTLFRLSSKVWGSGANRDNTNDGMEIGNAKEKGGRVSSERMRAPSVTSPRKEGGGSAVIRGSPLVGENNGREKGGVLYPKLKEAVVLLETENAGNFFTGSLSEALELVEPETAKVLEEKWHGHFVAGLKHFCERSELKEELLKTLLEAVKNA